MTHIIMGTTLHARFEPVKHQFKYPLYMIQTDINQLSNLDQSHLFLDNRHRVCLSMTLIFCIPRIVRFLRKFNNY